MFNIERLIKDKIESKDHTSENINYIVSSYLKDNITDQNMTQWLKAVYDKGMTIEETNSYTNAIINSGQKIKFKNIDRYIIDKHSTGGVGDKVSIILGPILAACNCYVPMIVGRFLGHTGGTLDKLESIPGYNGLIGKERFMEIVKKVGISIIGQTDEICPADRKIYALRDKTNTVASFPLICGSIMSKKIAEGIQGLVLDIKIGNGAFIKNSDEANNLGRLLSLIGMEFGIDVKYIHTDMNQPLGNYSGLLCEVNECIEALKGNGPKDLMKVVFDLGKIALSMANQNNPTQKMLNVINDGSALEILFKMIYEHGGDLKKVKTLNKHNLKITSKKEGYLKYTNTKAIGNAVNFITILNGKKDVNAGVEFLKKNGDYLYKGDPIYRIFANNYENVQVAKNMIQTSYLINMK